MYHKDHLSLYHLLLDGELRGQQKFETPCSRPFTFVTALVKSDSNLYTAKLSNVPIRYQRNTNVLNYLSHPGNSRRYSITLVTRKGLFFTIFLSYRVILPVSLSTKKLRKLIFATQIELPS